MNSPDENTEDLNAAYRRVSAADAGRPSETVRRAILAEAQAAALRRARPANDARYWLRGVAGVAVLGFAVLVWQQMDHRLPTEVPAVVTTESETLPAPVMESARDAAAPVIVEPAAAAPKPPSPAASTARELSKRESIAQEMPPPPAVEQPAENLAAASATTATPAPLVSVPSPASETVSVAAAAPALRADKARTAGAFEEERVLEEVAVTGSRVTAARKSASSATLLEQYFPEQHRSDSPQAVWLVRDASGNVLATGVLDVGEKIEDRSAEIAEEVGVSQLGRWRQERVRNARGKRVTLHVAIIAE
jgi:hypothetical protein